MVTDKPVVFVVDDDEQILSTFSFIICRQDMQAVCFNKPEEALKATYPLDNSCILLDLQMPSMHGLEVLQKLREQHIMLPVIIASGEVDVPLAVECMELGAFTLLEKPIGKASLLEKITLAIAHGNKTARQMLAKYEASMRVELLSNREKEVARLIAKGYRTATIAADLNISPRTVDTHREKVLTKLNLTSSSQISGVLSFVEH